MNWLNVPCWYIATIQYAVHPDLTVTSLSLKSAVGGRSMIFFPHRPLEDVNRYTSLTHVLHVNLALAMLQVP
jgi:hypothetical protein